ncbi:phosphoglycerate dehydrogenase [Candidatus Poribacteria bacterium]|nr:phosphoglycerate dehydrogenase [Candidatus Poribacteria bacterium]
MKKTAFICNNPDTINRVYDKGRKEKIAEISHLYPHIITSENINQHKERLKDVEAVFSTWGMPKLSDEQLNILPGLKAVFYAAGSVKGFAGPLLDRNIIVMSGWGANGVPVAEFALAQILLSNKGYFKNTRAHTSREERHHAYRGPGNFGETVAILGAGMIGKTLIKLLSNFVLDIIVWDPFLSPEDADKMGVEKVSTLKEAFQRGFVVTNHLANVPETVGLITGKHFSVMRPNATFINTGRGATIVEKDLISVFQEREDLTALLDVTYPEPPEEGSPLYTMPNVNLTSHIAGSMGAEVVRMADYAIEEFQAWEQGKPLTYEVTHDMLATMA